MHTDLTPEQCEELLEKNHYAHLGYVDNGQPYVLPITYIYKDGFLYSLSMEGHKIDSMRQHPSICIQVEHVTGEHAWQSVMCIGSYEEITDPQTVQDTKLLFADLHGDALWHHNEPLVSQIIKSTQSPAEQSVVYRLRPVQMTGKGESA